MQPSTTTRLRVSVRGAVQGVGFRPFIYRLANELGLVGWVNNSSAGVMAEVEGARHAVENFLVRIESEKPPRSFIQSLESSWLDTAGYKTFEIRESDSGGEKTALVLPDIAMCAECVVEIFDPRNRRFRYPFTNCTNCGPRFSIIEALPYDRANTAMKQFVLCADCHAEFENPNDRRFHAQPNACPVCGPQLELWDKTGNLLAQRDEALHAAARTIREGGIVALKGLGGFQLLVAAQDAAAVKRLRELKHREEKPFAVMYPSFDAVKSECEISPLEERLLRSPESPIVLLRRTTANSKLAKEIAPDNPNLGVMLPYTPLHHLLLAELNFPVVATSGNISDEPICIDEHEAIGRLGNIADVFLVHNRPIVRAVDDSVVRMMMGREMVLRRSRGYTPLPVTLRGAEAKFPSVLAVGAHLKNTVALAVGPQIFISQHIGDLENMAAYDAFKKITADLQKLFEAQPAIIARDTHPDYLSTKFVNGLRAANADLRVVDVQHHAAHVLSCMAENELEPPVLGISWDGTGYGGDGTIWGGEFLQVTATDIRRRAHLRQFALPGGDRAIKEPRRIALGVLWEIFGEKIFSMDSLMSRLNFSTDELRTFQKMLSAGINSPRTSSAGRLFDAVASLAGLRERVSFEGQAAMELEFALDGVHTNEIYPLKIIDGSDAKPLVLDWQMMIENILSDRERGLTAGEISAKFHNTMVEGMVEIANRIGEKKIALSGGCFQNRYLTERAVKRLTREGFRVYCHQRVPPNDGGIALGQVLAAMRAPLA
ncbi:MAG TPA: carbamoyltransferase HypF [Verrucomicrobiae bacterium]|nr:carbamoyltransferase HypF [Verrucomicrobiae bacterium]